MNSGTNGLGNHSSKKMFKMIVNAREAVKKFANELHLAEP